MKNYITISLIFLSTLCQAQINLVEHFSNLFALGNSLVIRNDTIHITGTTGLDIGNNQFAPAAFIASYDLNGNLLSYHQVGDTFRVYEGEKLLIDSMGNTYILGDFKNDSSGNTTNQGVFIQKRNSNNQILWTTEYQDSSSNVYYFMRNGILLENGNIAICGTYNISSPVDADNLFMIFDSFGNIIVHKRIGAPGVQEEARGIYKYDDNRIALGSVKNFPGAQGNNWVLMLDYQGNVLDEYISASDDRIGVWDIVKTQDGGLACASAASNGSFSNYKLKSFVEKLDSNLNQVWDYTVDWRFSSSNLGTSIDETPNGDIIVGGNVVDFLFDPDTAGKYGYLQKLSAQGDSIWYKAYTYYNSITIRERHSLFDLVIDNDRIYFVGDANDFDTTPPPGQSLWLVSTDSNGVVSNLNERIAVNEDIVVYPNPAREKLTLIMGQGGSANGVIAVFNLQGQLVYTSHFEGTELNIDLSSFQPSLYILHVQIEDERYRIRFVKD